MTHSGRGSGIEDRWGSGETGSVAAIAPVYRPRIRK